MSIAQTEEKKAVQAGYWHLYRFDPRLKAEGKNPFILDSKAPTADYKDFIMGEVRYNALARQNPERAEKLFGKAVQNAKDRYDYLLTMIICSLRKSNLSYFKKDAHALRCVGALFSPQKKGTATLTVPFIYAVANSVRPFLLSHG